MTKTNLKKVCDRAKFVIAEIERLSEERKKLYAEHDELAQKLRGEKKLEAEGLQVKRTFEKGNTQWGHGPVRELVLELVEPEKAAA